MLTRRGDIFLANIVFEEKKEQEQLQKARPVVVLADSENNDKDGGILVVPISSMAPRLKKVKYVQINPEYYDLKHEMIILTSRLTTISKERLVKKIARLSDNDLKRVENAIVDEFSESSFEKAKSDSRMKVYKDFYIEGSPEDISNLTKYLSNNVDTEIWSKSDKKDFPDFLIYNRESTSDISGAYLFLHLTDNKLEITNIVPSEKHSLTYDEYNHIIDEFYEKFIKPYIINFDTSLDITSSSPEFSINEYLTEKIADKLITFSSAANKATGSSHPLDERRWYDFITTSFRAKKIIPTSVLNRWLVEAEGWSDEIATQLSIEYEKAISLLEFYSESNTE
ncbi:mRNA-degrading endonuclease toxin of MazEF toxin-antitoxin module [Bacillus fengqiuensis]|nr:mRNA-degrading endonuclease toxin of MazEF toxin-antitoxin module [Bacillus fengqiuensis]